MPHGENMTEPEETYYVCMRVSDLPNPYVPCNKGKCCKCGHEVWYSQHAYNNDALIKKIVDAGKIICMRCALVKDKTLDVRPVTAEEIKEYFKPKYAG